LNPNADLSVGIDLGTTNCALATLSLADDDARVPAPTPLTQVLHAGEVGEAELLPSFLYLPNAAELAPGTLALPWDETRPFAVGAFAREHGAKVPARVISSAKSWLSVDGVDRRGRILPWQAPEDILRISPVQAQAQLLQHLAEAFAAKNPGKRLADEDVIITVPASFDAVARTLTEEAASQAGLSENLTLLEEPQAALYAWLAAHDAEGTWRDKLKVGDRVLVCDLGGGTTDFSLIQVGEEDGGLSLERIAVGNHILLGGDNMDLALAHVVRMKLEAEGKNLDDWQMRALTHSCRQAKEALLSQDGLTSHAVTVPGRGSKLIGGTITAELTRQEINAIFLDGFFPLVNANARPAAAKRAGLTTMGLPYASDPAVTRHLAAFVAGREPTAVLFNGGVTKSQLVQERILDALNHWQQSAGRPPARILEGADHDLGVSRGAAYYGKVRRGRGIRIRGGTARAYYVGIERAELAVPGIPPRVDAICVAPFGLEEGTTVTLPQDLALVVGEEASFRFFSSNERRDDQPADQVDPQRANLEELPPIETVLEADGNAGMMVPVKLQARVTEVGTLELAAVAAGPNADGESDTARKWKLEFNIRVEDASSSEDSGSENAGSDG
jgi:molecular chaperone DnaK (HSP70)